MPRSTSILIRGGRVIDPSQQLDMLGDVLMVDGVISAIELGGISSLGDDWEIFDATGKVVCPGFIDLHTHLRTPGQEWKEDPATVSDAAVRGGFTTICAMPNTYPAQDNASVVQSLIERCAAEAKVRVLPIGAITRGRQGKLLAPMNELADAGVIGFSDDGDPVSSSHLMRQALAYSTDIGLPIINHAEDRALVPDWDMNEGTVATRLGLHGLPNSAETMMIARDIELARITGGRLHVPHVSTAEAVEVIRAAKSDGLPITAEATPHHLALTETWVFGEHGATPKVLSTGAYDTNSKMAPPLRAEVDRAALLEGLADGTIDVIGTDHAPHADTDKVCTFTEAANGIIGLETAMPMLMDMAGIELKLAIERLTSAPASILGDQTIGNLKPGSRADVTIIDPGHAWRVDTSTLGSKSRNTPLLGLTASGRAIATFVGGTKIWDAREEEEIIV